MAKSMEKTKVTVTHPVSGNTRQFDETVYTAFKKAILESLKGSKGKTFTELSNEVKSIIKKSLPAFKGSVSWYTISVRLDLESKGVIENYTVKNQKFSKLKK